MLTDKQHQFFNDNAYVVVENFWTKSLCQQLRQRMGGLIKQNQQNIPRVCFSAVSNDHTRSEYFYDSADKVHFFLEKDALNERSQLNRPIEYCINKVGHGLHQADEDFKRASYDPRIKAICQQLGFARVGLLQSMYIFKQPTIGEQVNWHQDSSFLYMENSDVIGFWLALEDATVENGCLQVIPGRLDAPLKQRMICQHRQTQFENYDVSPWNEADKVNVEVPQGSLVMLHGRLPHASGPNLSEKSRHAYALHVIDASKHYSKQNWLQWPDAIPELH